MSAANGPSAGGKTSLDRKFLREESSIAQKYMQRFPWEMVAWGLVNLAVWLSIWPLTFSGVLPLWGAFGLSTLCCTLAYLPSHDAQHQSIAKKGSRLHWVNELIGHVSLIPIVLPYKVAWIAHREHHAHANDPDLDPDYGFNGKNVLHAIWNAIHTRQPAVQAEILRKTCERSNDPTIPRAIAEGVLLNTTYYVILTALAWSGYAIEAFFIWWLPRQLGYVYLTTCLAWAPHFPYEETGRYRDTRAWKSPVGTILSMGMEYHQIHHLFPRIPLFQTGPAYWEMRELLAKRGVRDDRPDALPVASPALEDANQGRSA
jgi:beta-carotene hydroxylase